MRACKLFRGLILFANRSLTTARNSPHVRTELVKWSRVVRERNIKVES